MADRLAEITARFHAGEQLSQEDAGWLIADATIKRGLLARLEWAGFGGYTCLACTEPRTRGHASGCWLAAELHPEGDR